MTVADRCPGVLRPHHAEDGLMVRLRIPGGRSDGGTLAALAELAARYGNPELQLTSRAALQIRGLPDPLPHRLVTEIAALGLLPSASHERARNILCSPLTGVSGGRTDLSPMVAELDHALTHDPTLADLPGRFLFTLDDGRGDVAGLSFDLAYQAESTDSGRVLVGDAAHSLPVSRRAAVATLVSLARIFLAVRPGFPGRGWHVRDLAGWAESVTGAGAAPAPLRPASPGVPLGVVGGAASTLVPLGLLTPAQAAALAVAAGGGPVVLTPWRGVVVPGAGKHVAALTAAGLVTDASSGWARVTACVGAPHCNRTRVDTRQVATNLVLTGVAERTHVSGCARRCGAPTTSHRELVGVT